MPIRNVPVVPRLTDLAVQVTEHGALHTAPGTRGTTPVPIGLGVYHTRPQLTTHRVQLPGVGAAADRLTRIPGQPTVGLRPAGDDGEKTLLVHQGHTVALLEPHRTQARWVEPGATPWVLGVCLGHERCSALEQATRLIGLGSALVVGQPHGDANTAAGVQQIGGRGVGVAVDDDTAALIGTDLVEQDLDPCHRPSHVATLCCPIMTTNPPGAFAQCVESTVVPRQAELHCSCV